MGKVKNWLMDLEEDAASLNYPEFVRKHGREHADIWLRVNELEEYVEIINPGNLHKIQKTDVPGLDKFIKDAAKSSKHTVFYTRPDGVANVIIGDVDEG
jgi:hypothetical protein